MPGVSAGGDTAASTEVSSKPVPPAPGGPIPTASAGGDTAASTELPSEDLSAEEDAPWPEAAAEDEDASPWSQAYDPYVDSPEGVLVRAQIRGGAILVGSGVLLAAGGLALGLSDPCARAAGNSCSAQSRNRAAITMFLPAAAMLAAGGALLGVGLKHRRELRAAVTADASGGHVAIAGRF